MDSYEQRSWQSQQLPKHPLAVSHFRLSKLLIREVLQTG